LIIITKNTFAFFITLIFITTLCGFGQTRIKLPLNPFPAEDSILSVMFKTNRMPDTTKILGLKGQCKLKNQCSVYFLVSNSGAILVFVDSLFQIPIPVEKKNFFPFHYLAHFSTYFIQVSCLIGNDGYLAFRLKEAGSRKILDEVFVCTPWIDVGILGIALYPSSYFQTN